MSLVERYISKVGAQTGDTMKVILFELLVDRYRCRPTDKGDRAEKLAACVVDYLFCETSKHSELQSFTSENAALIESRAKELASDENLCRALTCALYNFCYGKYVDSGRKVGIFFHHFLGYVRALQEVIACREPASFLNSFEVKAGANNVAPLLKLSLLGLFRPLPHTPDSKLMMDEVASFGQSIPLSGTAKENETSDVASKRANITGEIAQLISETFSVARFTEFFKGQTFSDGWTLGEALLMWQALGQIALAVSASRAYNRDMMKVLRVLHLCEPELRTRWNMSEDDYQHFQLTVHKVMPEFLAAFEACETGEDLQYLSSRYVDRILGVPVSLSVSNQEFPLMDYLSVGAEPRAGLAFSHSVWSLFFPLIKSTAGVLSD
jgi:hypothetical protein